MLYLPVRKNLIPISMLVAIEGDQYEIKFNYNTMFDFFTVDLLRDQMAIITGEKVLINKPLFTSRDTPFKNTIFIPLDLSGEIDRITYENFNESVFIYAFRLENDMVVELNE